MAGWDKVHSFSELEISNKKFKKSCTTPQTLYPNPETGLLNHSFEKPYHKTSANQWNNLVSNNLDDTLVEAKSLLRQWADAPPKKQPHMLKIEPYLPKTIHSSEKRSVQTRQCIVAANKHIIDEQRRQKVIERKIIAEKVKKQAQIKKEVENIKIRREAELHIQRQHKHALKVVKETSIQSSEHDQKDDNLKTEYYLRDIENEKKLSTFLHIKQLRLLRRMIQAFALSRTKYSDAVLRFQAIQSWKIQKEAYLYWKEIINEIKKNRTHEEIAQQLVLEKEQIDKAYTHRNKTIVKKILEFWKFNAMSRVQMKLTLMHDESRLKKPYVDAQIFKASDDCVKKVNEMESTVKSLEDLQERKPIGVKRTVKDMKIITDMEKRDEQRRNRRLQVEERRKEKELIAKKEQEYKIAMKAQEESKQKAWIAEQKQIEMFKMAMDEKKKDEERKRTIENMKKAKEHHRLAQIKFFGFVQLKTRRNEQLKLNLLAQVLEKKSNLRGIFRIWKDAMLGKQMVKEEAAGLIHEKRTLIAIFHIWNERLLKIDSKVNTAGTSAAKKLISDIFKKWQTERKRHESKRIQVELLQCVQADKLYSRITMKQYYKKWVLRILQEQQNKKRDLRRNIIRKKIKQLLVESKYESVLENAKFSIF